jgi:hypothetical protein
MKLHHSKKCGLHRLKNLEGLVLDQGNGYWAQINACFEPDSVSHGMRFLLSLHDHKGKQLLVYEIDHEKNSVPLDQFIVLRHPYDPISRKAWPYMQRCHYFTLPDLLADFFMEIDAVINHERNCKC